MKRSTIVTALIAFTLLSLPQASLSQTFMCAGNPDYFTKRCTIHPYAVTKVTDGMVEKGHLVGCQFKSYTCMRFDRVYQCRDNFGTAVVPFNFSMNDLKEFCYLLCNNPSCPRGQVPNDGWQ